MYDTTMSIQKLVIDTHDYRGKRVIFTEDKWVEKQIVHPELKRPVFLRNVAKAVECPDEVWPDYSDKRKRCYYKKYSTTTYVKVVVWHKGNPCAVVTAYEINKIKEANYPSLRRIK